MLSFWEKESFVEYDRIIIGGGIVGLSTAISLKENEPSASVLVLERGIFPSGASTKNAGFACFGSLTELINDIDTLGPDGMLELVNLRWEGLVKLRERIGDTAMDYQGYGGYELIRKQELPFLERLDEVNDLLLKQFNKPVFELRPNKAKEFGFEPTGIRNMIFNQFEGQIHTGKMMKSLIEIAQSKGVEILTGCEVNSFDEGDGVSVHCKSSTYNQDITLKCGQLAICTNAFSKKLLPDLELNPGRGIVLVTKPIHNLSFKGVFHIDRGYYYFRNVGDRVIFGGGRNLDFDGETTTKFGINTMINHELERQLREVILPNNDFEVEHAWAGIMAFGPDKAPIIKQHSDNIYLGLRLGGMGVAIGSKLGEKLAEKMR